MLCLGRAGRQQSYEAAVDLGVEFGVAFRQRSQQTTGTLLSLFRPRSNNTLCCRANSCLDTEHRRSESLAFHGIKRRDDSC